MSFKLSEIYSKTAITEAIRGGPEIVVQTLMLSKWHYNYNTLYRSEWRGETQIREITDERKDKIFIESFVDMCNVKITF